LGLQVFLIYRLFLNQSGWRVSFSVVRKNISQPTFFLLGIPFGGAGYDANKSHGCATSGLKFFKLFASALALLLI
jgi:hypothetical protein